MIGNPDNNNNPFLLHKHGSPYAMERIVTKPSPIRNHVVLRALPYHRSPSDTLMRRREDKVWESQGRRLLAGCGRDTSPVDKRRYRKGPPMWPRRRGPAREISSPTLSSPSFVFPGFFLIRGILADKLACSRAAAASLH